MASTFKRNASRGFTLIELLIVVIILAILAAIAIPQFSSSTNDAQVAALDSNLAAVRSAVEQYKVQHKGKYPADNTSAGATCAVGAKVEAAAGTQAAMEAQLKGYSDVDGKVCDSPNDTYKFGPYLRQGIPNEPINNSKTVVVTTTGAAISAGTAGGWAYDTKSGQFIMNSTAQDANKTAYSAH
jgi:general secretion pathway protein G